MEQFFNLSKSTLSLGDIISIAGIIIPLIFYCISRVYIITLSKYYKANKIYFNFYTDSKVKYYLLALGAFLFATVYCVVSSFYKSNNCLLLISIIPLVLTSLMIILVYLKKLDILNYSYKKKRALRQNIRRGLIVIIYIIANFIFIFAISVYIFVLSVERDTKKFAENKIAIDSELKINKQSNKNYDEIFEALGEKSYDFGKLGIKDRITYFNNPEEFIKSDFMDLKEENLDGFIKYLKDEKYDTIVYNLLKVLLLLRSYTYINVLFSVSSTIFVLCILVKLVCYYINPKYKLNYIIIDINDKKFAILNEYENKFVCVNYYETDNSETLVLKTDTITTYSPTEYRLDELLYKSVVIS